MPVINSQQEIDGEMIAIYIEVDRIPEQDLVDPYPDLLSPADKTIEALSNVFGKGLELASDCARCVVQGLNQLEQAVRPDEFQVELAISLVSEVGVPALAKLGSEAQMKVTMKWIEKEK